MAEEIDVADILAKYNVPKSAWDDPYTLMSRLTGKDIGEFEHMILCIFVLLTTRIGTRCMMREYGCSLVDLLDRPFSPDKAIDFYAAVVDAIIRWEPRLKPTKVLIDFTLLSRGVLTLDIYGVYLLEGRVVRLKNVNLDFTTMSKVA